MLVYLKPNLQYNAWPHRSHKGHKKLNSSSLFKIISDSIPKWLYYLYLPLFHLIFYWPTWQTRKHLFQRIMLFCTLLYKAHRLVGSPTFHPTHQLTATTKQDCDLSITTKKGFCSAFICLWIKGVMLWPKVSPHVFRFWSLPWTNRPNTQLR